MTIREDTVTRVLMSSEDAGDLDGLTTRLAVAPAAEAFRFRETAAAPAVDAIAVPGDPDGAAAAAGRGAEQSTLELAEVVARLVAGYDAELIGMRRQIHAHPELSGAELATAALVQRRLRRAGLRPRLIPTRNGVLCDVGTGDRTIALRADLDALALPDTKDVPYRSTVPGVCHACGHDAHTTMLAGAGLVLADLHAMRLLPGRVRLVFQPAEERLPSGAPVMIGEGAVDGVDAIYALHCAPYLPVHHVGVRSGPITAALDTAEVRLTGRGGHTARPHLTGDLVNALGRVVVDTPALLSRRCDPRSGASMVFGAVHAGEAVNAIPIEGTARATVRVLSRDTWLELPDLVSSLVNDVVAGTGVAADVAYVRGLPPVVNDPVATAIAASAARAALGPDRVLEAELSMGAEDFAFYLQHVPGSMIRLGVGGPSTDDVADIHQSAFDLDERAIATGVRVLVHAAIAALTAPELGRA